MAHVTMGRLDDKIAVITGAAGSTARRFVAEGARVVLADLDQQRLQQLAGELGGPARSSRSRPIRVNMLHPGPVDNAFQHRIETTATGRDEASANAIFDGMIPLGRHARADEVAAAALYLASDESAFLTGATVPLDGGMSI
ncbi:hypothetical protein DSM104299_00895 [Baekduia alba]|uniref:SDR family oxidoreductase n=1 Tax=Baekduia alba TaxID=2997333 RepID=UPI0023421CA7|nr:SDR family oxidoreductase [Baekduia alba]WCB92205.1 hypothetical protein DSM104299_00895 [Baekduia alba]